MKYKIAYIDESDQWLNTFYHTFKNDFDVMRIKVDNNFSIESILEILQKNELDAVVTDYLLEDDGSASFNGNKIVDAIRGYKPHFPIIMLTSYVPEAIGHMDDVHIIYGKNILDGESEAELELFKVKIKANIDNYYSKINSTRKEIEELIEKRQEQSLEPAEEERLTKLLILLDELEPEGKGLPLQLTQPDSITKLNEFVSQTREILEELRKKNQQK